MYEQNDKRYLYDLINNYLENKIDEDELCDKIYDSFVHEIDDLTLNDIELEAFSELEKVTKRFSAYEEDHKLDSKAFTTKEEVRQAAIDAKNKLQRGGNG